MSELPDGWVLCDYETHEPTMNLRLNMHVPNEPYTKDYIENIDQPSGPRTGMGDHLVLLPRQG